MAQWRERSAFLAKLRREEIRAADTAQFIHSMSGVLEAVLSELPVRTSSGLVEQQAIFSRLRP